MGTCKGCGAACPTRQKYCSRACVATARRKDKTRICTVCGATFEVCHSRQQYCSQRCNAVVTQAKRYETGYYPQRVELTCEQCGVAFSVKPSYVQNKTNGSVKRFCSRACKGLASRGVVPIEQTNKIVYTCQECGKQWYDKPSLQHRKKFCSPACVGSATVRKLCAKSPTSIEVATYAALKELGIAFTVQHRIGRWVADALLPDLKIVVECQGDFHHCNPNVYPNGPRHPIQEKTVARDKRRIADFEAMGYRVVQLWEADIHTVGAKALLEKYLSSMV